MSIQPEGISEVSIVSITKAISDIAAITSIWFQSTPPTLRTMAIQIERKKQTQTAASNPHAINITLLSKVTSQLPKSAPQFAFCVPLRWEKRRKGGMSNGREILRTDGRVAPMFNCLGDYGHSCQSLHM